MRFIQIPFASGKSGTNIPPHGSNVRTVATLVAIGICCSSAATAASTASISRSIVVQGTPAAVWSMIGSFCAIEKWLPPVGTCSEDGGTPPTRTLVTRDGSATFVERQTARSDSEYVYSYVFVSSPLPVTGYSSSIRVTASGQGQSTVSWNGTYIPDAGKEDEAAAALDGIYAAGLESIQLLAAQQLAPLAVKPVTP